MGGMGHNAEINDPDGICDNWWLIDGDRDANMHVYMENLTIDCAVGASCPEGAIAINKAKLSARDCTFRLGTSGIAVRPSACVNINHCVFDGASTAITISPAAEQVIIKNTLFKGCGKETEFSH